MRITEPLLILLLFLGLVACTMIPPLVFAVASGESAMVRAFAVPMSLALAAALPALFVMRKKPFHLRPRDGFILVFITWVSAGFMGAIPFYLAGGSLSPHTVPDISFTNAFFESTCAFATTGATTFADVEALPRSLLLWRSMSHWFGGMGIVLLSVALMPLLGVGGFQLIKAEAPGPEKEKITPKVTATAKLLWLVYCALTLILTVLFFSGGMDFFDALCHAFTTMASGGVSTKTQGIASYHSAFIDGTATVFMLLSGLNFNLYYRLLKGKFKDIVTNTEGRAYLLIFLTASAAITITLIPQYGSVGNAARYAAYQSASVLSTTGSSIANYDAWPSLAKMILLCLMFIGGCSGSTAGGIKVIRHAILFKQAGNELKRTIFPRGIFSVHLNKKVGRKDVVYGAAGFVFLYMMVVMGTTLISAASGIDPFTSFSAALSMTGNLGAGFGGIGPAGNFAAFPDHLKWLYSFVMVAGRLELWTVFVLFTREYWRR
ncbi:MAG: TrkH family potassium uptake protein [Spirochaetaceae bacterium]|jgi:trk system potassium uptake protein TrkH|nr:TrkH family potassium uptake protein [Spirochaetaceae bacterium]